MARRGRRFSFGYADGQCGDLQQGSVGIVPGGSGSWAFQPQINLPIFNAGSLRASLDYAKIQKNIFVAQYEKSIQTAFQEVSNGLAARQTYNEQLAAQRDFVRANQKYYDLAQHRYRSGVDSNLVFLDAQRSLFTSQQALIVDRLAQLVAEVNLYTALGGGGTWVPRGLRLGLGAYPFLR